MNFLPPTNTTKSSFEGTLSRFDFTNHSGKTLNLYWIDYEGKEIGYGEVQNGSSIKQLGTLSTHVWEIKSNDGTIAFKFVLGEQFGLVDVTSSRLLKYCLDKAAMAGGPMLS